LFAKMAAARGGGVGGGFAVGSLSGAMHSNPSNPRVFLDIRIVRRSGEPRARGAAPAAAAVAPAAASR
jgi:hypothetical protein